MVELCSAQALASLAKLEYINLNDKHNCHSFSYLIIDGISGVARAIELVGHRCACAKALTTPTN